MSVLDKYKASGNLKLHISPRSNSLKDAFGNTAVASAGVSWSNGRRGHALNFRAGATHYLTVADAAGLRATEGTFIMFCDPIRSQYINQTIFDHEAGTGTRVNLVATGAAALQLFDGVTNPSFSGASITGKRMIAVRFKTGVAPILYLDGIYSSTSGTLSTIANSPTGDFVLGGYDYYPAGCDTSVYDFIFINTYDVTHQDISQLYEELMAQRGSGDPKTRNYKAFMPKIESNCLLAYDMVTKTGDGKLADLSGNNKVGTFVGTVKERLANAFDGRKFGTGTNVTFSSLTFGTVHTFEFVGDLVADESMIFGGAANYGFYYYGGNTVRYQTSVATSVTWTIALDKNPHHYVVDRNGTSVILYIDGVSQGTKTLGANEALPAVTALTETATWTWKGRLAYVQVYSDSKGASWVSARYSQYAKNPVYRLGKAELVPTLANVTAGRIGNTDFTQNVGTWSVIETATKKAIKGRSNSAACATPSKDAFGTWVLKLNKPNTSANSVFRFIATKPGLYNGAGEQGYYFAFLASEALGLYRNNAGGTIIMNTAAPYAALNTDYWFAVSRDYLGVFKLYIRGGAFTNWTLVGTTAADLTYTACNYMVLEENTAGLSEFSDIRHYQGVLDLSTLPND